MQHILVLCIGNICRSPMGEAMLRMALPGKTVRSAGLGALIGKPADPLAVQLMAEQNVDITEHRAQLISLTMVTQADLILVMDFEQKRHVETHYMSARGKVFRLGEAAKADIPDPYREGIDNFRIAHKMIDKGATFWAAQILRMN